MLEQVEKYDILEEIGHGGMATVYRARDTRLNRLVALKVMHPHLQGAKEARARFEREAQTVARLQHRGLLEIYDYSGEDSETSYIATELLTGPTLKQFVELHLEIPAELAACMVLQVAEALSAAHDAGVIHRDVKPENVMLHHGHVKLTDFGIAQLVDAQGMTTTGQVLGSPGHMAPEQIEGKDCTVQSDLFSLGTVLYLLAVGALPFQGRNPHQILKAIVEGKFPDALRTRASIGAPLSRIIVRCLATDPARRYQNAAALAADLSKFIAAVGIRDPDAALSAYLEGPEEYALEFTASTIDTLIDRGERAQRILKLPEALDDFNRVLALDEGNPRVLAAVQRLGRRSRARRVGLWATALCGLAAASAGALALVHQRPVPQETGVAPPIEVVAKLPPVPKPPVVPQAPSEPTPPPTTKPAPAPARARATTERARIGSVRAERTEPAGDGPRRVLFSPLPANVSISVDGAPPKPFGPSFREIQLAPGTHRFRFVGAHDCCEDLEFKEDIPAGPGTTNLSRTLKFKPAGLYVVSDRPANVQVDGGDVKGRSRNVLQVPHDHALLQMHEIKVTAEGYSPFKARVQLRAGQVKTLEVSLRALASAKASTRP